MNIFHWILKKWHLYRGVAYSHPVSRYHYERFEYHSRLLKGEHPRIPKRNLYKKVGESND